jgi:hypothetical protein
MLVDTIQALDQDPIGETAVRERLCIASSAWAPIIGTTQ